MSVSLDDEVAEGGEDSRAVLAGWLDDYGEDRCELEDLREAVLSVCQRDPDAPWEALALLDQYTRRGRITAELAQSLKADIEKLVFGQKSRRAAPAPIAPVAQSEPTVARLTEPAPADSTSDLQPHAPQASRPLAQPEPHRLIPERDEPSTRPGTAFIDRTVLRAIDDDSEARAPAFSRSTTRRAPQITPRATSVGRVLRDRYELESVIGRGGSGVVYRAVDRRRQHLSESARCVAVKVLNQGHAQTPMALAELEREFHQAQSLAHPNIVSVFDLDRDGDDYFIVMELLEGELLSRILAQLGGRPMRREHAFAIIDAVGSALSFAHGRDIVHADLKPGAIMITSSGEVRVLDFGFARNRAFDLHTAAAANEPPAPSPAYASVERVNGSEPDVSDDVYSLACIAYELLTGQHPFGGRSALLARAHGRRPPRVRGFNHKQWSALQRALLWTRGERRIAVAELLGALETANASHGRAAPEDIVLPPDDPARWLRGGALAAVLAVLVATAVYFAPQLLPREPRRAADAAAPVSAPEENVDLQTQPAGPEQSGPERTSPSSQPQKRQLAAAAAESRRNASAQSEQKQGSSAQSRPAGGGIIEFDKDTYVANESDGTVRLQVKRSGSTRGDASFSWSIRGNSAEAGADFAAIGPVSEQIPSGDQTASLTIPLVSDGLVENTELFLVELHAASGESVGERSHAAVIIVDDD